MDKESIRWILLGVALGIGVVLLRTQNYILALVFGFVIYLDWYIWQQSYKNKFTLTAKAQRIRKFIITSCETLFIIAGLAFALYGIKVSIPTTNDSSTWSIPMNEAQQLTTWINWYFLAIYIIAGAIACAVILFVIEVFFTKRDTSLDEIKGSNTTQPNRDTNTNQSPVILNLTGNIDKLNTEQIKFAKHIADGLMNKPKNKGDDNGKKES